MKIRIANSAGFCYGVRRAVELAEGAARSGEPCVMLGPIIHNQDMMDHLARHGLRAVVRPEEVPEGSEVIIRSHGESRAVHEGLHARGVRILDATCPNVTRIHQIVARAEEQGRQPIIIGTRDHPEVLAIAGWCCRPVVLSGAEELENWLAEDPSLSQRGSVLRGGTPFGHPSDENGRGQDPPLRKDQGRSWKTTGALCAPAGLPPAAPILPGQARYPRGVCPPIQHTRGGSTNGGIGVVLHPRRTRAPCQRPASPVSGVRGKADCGTQAERMWSRGPAGSVTRRRFACFAAGGKVGRPAGRNPPDKSYD